MVDETEVTPPDPWIRTTSPEQSIHLCKTSFYPHRLRLLGPPHNFGLTHRVTRVGPITVGDITYDTDVALGFDEIRASYHVNVPLKGWLRSRHRGQETTPSPEVASIYRPDGEIAVTRWPGGTRNLAVKIDQVALERALENLVDGPVESPIPFTAALPLESDAAQSWVRLLLMVQRHIDRSDSVLRHSIVSVPLAESLIHGFCWWQTTPIAKHLLRLVSLVIRWRCVTRWTSLKPERTSRSPLRHSLGNATSACARCKRGSAGTWACRRWHMSAWSDSAVPTGIYGRQIPLTAPSPRLRTAGGSPTSAGSQRHTKRCTARHRCKPCALHADLTKRKGQ